MTRIIKNQELQFPQRFDRSVTSSALVKWGDQHFYAAGLNRPIYRRLIMYGPEVEEYFVWLELGNMTGLHEGLENTIDTIIDEGFAVYCFNKWEDAVYAARRALNESTTSGAVSLYYCTLAMIEQCLGADSDEYYHVKEVLGPIEDMLAPKAPAPELTTLSYRYLSLIKGAFEHRYQRYNITTSKKKLEEGTQGSIPVEGLTIHYRACHDGKDAHLAVYENRHSGCGSLLLIDRLGKITHLADEAVLADQSGSANFFLELVESLGLPTDRPPKKAQQEENTQSTNFKLYLEGLGTSGVRIEAGARKFTDYILAMRNELGSKFDSCKLYLKSWYNAIRYDPAAADWDMDGFEEVEKTDIDYILYKADRDKGSEGTSSK